MEGVRRNSHYLSHLLQHSKPKLVFLQEVWLQYFDENILSKLYPDYIFKIASPDMFEYPEDQLLRPNHVWHGVAIGWRKDVKGSIQILESSFERAVGIRMTLSEKSMLFVSFYAPTSGHDDDFLEAISSLSDYLERNSSAGDQFLIGTDCNCSAKSSSRRKEAWKSFCNTFDLRSHAPPSPTFHHHNAVSHSSIDVFAASMNLNLSNVIQYCSLDTPMNLSCHDPIETNLRVQLDVSKVSKFSHTYSSFVRNKIIWEA